MGRTQKLAAIIKEGVRNPQKIKKGLKVLKNQGPEIFKQRLSASVNYEPGYGRVKKEKLKNYSGEILFSIEVVDFQSRTPSVICERPA